MLETPTSGTIRIGEEEMQDRPAFRRPTNLVFQHLALFPHMTVFKNIALANVATSAEMGKRLGYFHPSDGISFDRARQLYEAKQRVIGLAESGYHPPIPRAHKLPGESGIATLGMRRLRDHVRSA